METTRKIPSSANVGFALSDYVDDFLPAAFMALSLVMAWDAAGCVPATPPFPASWDGFQSTFDACQSMFECPPDLP